MSKERTARVVTLVILAAALLAIFGQKRGWKLSDMRSLGQPQRLPPQPFRGLGVLLRERWELWRNRHER